MLLPRLCFTLGFLCCFSHSFPLHDPNPGTVLVLGSEGFIGRSVVQVRHRIQYAGLGFYFYFILSTCAFVGSGPFSVSSSLYAQWLHKAGFSIIEVKNRRHFDLRESGSLDHLGNESIDFAIFLACEVGGSKFLTNPDSSIQADIIQSNVLIYQNVFGFLEERQIPFAFVSSYLYFQDDVYGTVKRLGELWTTHLKGSRGSIVRFWNIFGASSGRDVLRQHVATDWVDTCVNGTSSGGLDGAAVVIPSRTDGTEVRQFLHVTDAAAVLGYITQLSIARTLPSATEKEDEAEAADLPPLLEVSSGQWTSLRDLALVLEAAAKDFGLNCTVQFPEEARSQVRWRKAPTSEHDLSKFTDWRPQVSLEEGVKRMFRERFKVSRL